MRSLDKNILIRFKNGDAGAFDVIFHHYSERIHQIALGLLKNEALADDIVQEVFVSLWLKRDKLNPELKFDNYLITIAYNAIRNEIRKESLKTRTIAILIQDAQDLTARSDADLVYRELYELAGQAIEKLPPKRKAVYRLSKQEGLKIKEIADKLNISTRTAENHLARALKYLKEELSRYTLVSILFFLGL